MPPAALISSTGERVAAPVVLTDRRHRPGQGQENSDLHVVGRERHVTRDTSEQGSGKRGNDTGRNRFFLPTSGILPLADKFFR